MPPTRSRLVAEPLLRGRGPDKVLPDPARDCSRAPSDTCRRWTACRSRSRPARCSGLVGESGCGKTTTGRCILRLIEPTVGQRAFRGPRDHGAAASASCARCAARCRSSSRIRTRASTRGSPSAACWPRRSPIHKLARGRGRARARRRAAARWSGSRPDHARRYPHEFSGGQRQRIGVARALARAARS